MIPAYLIRAGIDWVRHSPEYQDSNPYSRCEQVLATCNQLWTEQIGEVDKALLEPASVIAYWAEFFHATDPLADEDEWREGLLKRSSQYDSFDEWQDWFKQQYASVYKDDIIWMGVLTTAWAHTHQYEVLYSEDSWEFRPATSYLPTFELWRLEPHIDMIAEILNEVWLEEIPMYEEMGFVLEEARINYLGKAECLGFDTKRITAVWPPRAGRDTRQEIGLGEMVADIVLPPSAEWYRQRDNVIFAHDYVDATALINRAKYVFESRRRLLELMVDSDEEQARIQAHAEGWLVPAPEAALA
jgi:hypothetical protein